MQCDIPGEGQPQLDPVSSHLTQVVPPQTQDKALQSVASPSSTFLDTRIGKADTGISQESVVT